MGMADVIGLGILLRWKDQATSQMKKAEQRLVGLGESADEAMKKSAALEASYAKLGKVGAVITGFGVAGVAGLVGITKAAGTFQETLRDTMTMTGLTGDAFTDMEKNLADLSFSLSGKFGMAASEINKAFYQVLSSGAQAGTKQFTALTDSALMMAKVVGMEPAVAVEQMSDALHSFEMDVAEAEKMADLFFKTSMLGATTVPQMALAMREASKVAVELGIPIEDLGAVLTGFAGKGIKGAEAGTAFRMVMTKLAAPSGEAAEALSGLGVEVYDAATRKMRPVIDIFEDMKTGLSAVSHEEREAALKAITGEEAFAKLGGLLASDLSVLRDWSEELKKGGVMQTAFAQKTGTIGFAATQFKESLRNLAIILGQTLLPVVTPVISKMGQWAIRLQDFLKAHPGVAKVAVAFTAVASAVALVAGPILMVVGLIGSLGGVTAIVGSIGAGFASLAGAGAAVGGALAAAFWPVTLTIAALGLLYLAVRTNFLGIGTIVKTTIGVVWSYMKGFYGALYTAAGPIVEMLGESFSALKDAFAPIIEGGIAIAKALGIVSDGSSAMGGFMDVAKVVGVVVAKALIFPLWLLVKVNTVLIKAFAWLVKAAVSVGMWFGEKLVKHFDVVKDVLLFLLGPIGLVIRNFDKIKTAAKIVIDWFATGWGVIKDIVLAPVGLILEGWTVLKDGLVGLFTSIKDVVVGAFESIKATIGEALDWVWNKIAWVIAKIPDTLLPESLVKVKKEMVGGGLPVGGQMIVPATAPAAQRAMARPRVPRDAGALPSMALAASGGGPVDQSIVIQSGAVVINATRVDESIVLKIEHELAKILECRRERR